jgi:hypothetical protein
MRRCSKRWLDEDCPEGVVAIIDNPAFTDRYTIIYNYVNDGHVTYLGTNSSGSFSGHGFMQTHEVSAYRYREKNRYIRWSDLPDTVKAMVRSDLGKV